MFGSSRHKNSIAFKAMTVRTRVCFFSMLFLGLATGCGNQKSSKKTEENKAAQQADKATKQADKAAKQADKAAKQADKATQQADKEAPLGTDPHKVLPAPPIPNAEKKAAVAAIIGGLRRGEPGDACVFNEQCKAPMECIQETECRLRPCSRILPDPHYAPIEGEEGEEPNDEVYEEIKLNQAKQTTNIDSFSSPYYEGSVNREFVYDAHGREYAEFFDYLNLKNHDKADQEPDQLIIWHYDDKSRLVKKEIDGMVFLRTRTDELLIDGQTDGTVVYEYDNANRLIRKTLPSGNHKGTWNMTWKMTYGKNGRLKEKALVNDATKKVQELERYSYDAKGRLIRINGDSDGDGEMDWDSKITYSKSDAGNPIKTVRESSVSTAELDTINIYEYDNEGRLVREIEKFDDVDSDEPLMMKFMYYYDCYN